MSPSEPEHPTTNTAESTAQNWRRPITVIGLHRSRGGFPTAGTGCRVWRHEVGDVRMRLRKRRHHGRWLGGRATTLGQDSRQPTSHLSTTFCRSIATQYVRTTAEGDWCLFRIRLQIDRTKRALRIASAAVLAPGASNDFHELDGQAGVWTLVAAVLRSDRPDGVARPSCISDRGPRRRLMCGRWRRRRN